MAQDIKQRKTEKELSAQEKTKRGWWFSVFFMLLVVGLILFLTYVEIVSGHTRDDHWEHLINDGYSVRSRSF